ncbi:tetraspanin-8-like [Centroberyx gerrardi]|uniref:tetraspanin-8-like n=1 Tax=Centroberyx gerrardi TaxID=166262 RepID=UPI003AAEF977
MGKINGCLKCLFIFFNVLFGIVGALLILGAVKAGGYSRELAVAGSPSHGWYWVFALGVLFISCLGVFAGCAEKELVLKVFAGFMVAGLLIMMIIGIIIAAYRNKLKADFDSASSEVAEKYMAEEGFNQFLSGFQKSTHCCGVVSAKDWGAEIPDSCECHGYSGCTARPQGLTGPDQVYAQSCGGFIFTLLDIFFKIGMGFFFGFAVTALLGLLVSLLMIHQLRRHDGAMGGQSIAMKGSGY